MVHKNAEILVRDDLPTQSQLEEYTDYLRYLMRETGRGVRRHIRYETINGIDVPRISGAEIMVIGALTQTSSPDNEGYSEVERERQISAMYKIGVQSLRSLFVTESDSVRLPDRNEFQTLRSVYGFAWSHEGIYRADVRRVEMITSAVVDAELLPRFAKDNLVMDISQTSEPFRVDFGRTEAKEVDVDSLMYNTKEYGREILLAMERDI